MKTPILLLGSVFACLFFGCSNSEWSDLTNEDDSLADWEYPIITSRDSLEIYEPKIDSIRNENNVKDNNSSAEKNYTNECFDNYRLPKLDSKNCKKAFFALDTVKYFPESGFFEKTFIIAFPNKKAINCEIGGKAPTKKSPLTSALHIDSSMTIRCIDYSSNTNPEIIRTYILEKKPSIPAVFITTDPNSLFDPDTGIYMEGPNAEKKEPHYGANYWLDKEIPIFVEFVEPNKKNPAFAKYAGLKIFGNYSRVNEKKSVAITFREKYGDKRLYYPLFPEFPQLTMFKSFILRNNGNNFFKDYIRDRLATSISEGLNVDYQRGRFATVYYNGKYFGIHDLRERSNEYYFETHYGINHNNINLLDAHNRPSAGSSDDFTSIMNWLYKNSLDNDENYAFITSKIDIDNYINYMQIEIFAYNHDWPGNNLKKWNSVAPQTPWKWFLFDLDWGFGKKYVNKNIFDFLSSKGDVSYANAPEHTYLFRSLLANKKFKSAFINRMTTLLQMNFESSRILHRIENMMNEIKTEIPKDQDRWDLKSSKMNSELDDIKQFATERQSYLIKHIQEYFELNENVPITLSVKGNGRIHVHNLPLDKPTLTIPFFKGFPVTISAEPQNGESWSCWSDGDTNAIRTILPNEAANLIATFK